MKKLLIVGLITSIFALICISGCINRSPPESVTTCTIEEVLTPIPTPNYTYETFVGIDGQIYTQKYETYDLAKQTKLVRNVCITTSVIGDSNYDLFVKSITGG